MSAIIRRKRQVPFVEEPKKAYKTEPQLLRLPSDLWALILSHACTSIEDHQNYFNFRCVSQLCFATVEKPNVAVAIRGLLENKKDILEPDYRSLVFFFFRKLAPHLSNIRLHTVLDDFNLTMEHWKLLRDKAERIETLSVGIDFQQRFKANHTFPLIGRFTNIKVLSMPVGNYHLKWIQFRNLLKKLNSLPNLQQLTCGYISVPASWLLEITRLTHLKVRETVIARKDLTHPDYQLRTSFCDRVFYGQIDGHGFIFNKKGEKIFEGEFQRGLFGGTFQKFVMVSGKGKYYVFNEIEDTLKSYKGDFTVSKILNGNAEVAIRRNYAKQQKTKMTVRACFDNGRIEGKYSITEKTGSKEDKAVINISGDTRRKRKNLTENLKSILFSHYFVEG